MTHATLFAGRKSWCEAIDFRYILCPQTVRTVTEERLFEGTPMTRLPSSTDDGRLAGAGSIAQNPQSIRDALALKYHAYVYKIARQVASTYRTSLDVDDLAGWGCLGLLEAAERYCPDRGVRFRSFAHARIRGAMIDAIRTNYGRRLSTSGVSSESEARHRMVTMTDAGYTTVDEDEGSKGKLKLALAIEPSVVGQQDSMVLRAEFRHTIEVALRALTKLERTIIVQHYLNGEDVCVIARRHGYSKSWFSRVHARALAKLRSEIEAHESSPSR